jgi:hypothetical protein
MELLQECGLEKGDPPRAMRWIRSTRKGTNRELRREERKKWTGWPECETGNSRPARGDERGRRRSRGEKGRPKMTIEQHTIEPKRLRRQE